MHAFAESVRTRPASAVLLVCATDTVRYPDVKVSILFLLGRFLRHLLRQTRGVFFVLDIINRESPEHVVGIVPRPILVGIVKCHLGGLSLGVFVMNRIGGRWIHNFRRTAQTAIDQMPVKSPQR